MENKFTVGAGGGGGRERGSGLERAGRVTVSTTLFFRLAQYTERYTIIFDIERKLEYFCI